MNKTGLINKSCVPCQGGMLPLGQVLTQNLLAELNAGWIINETGHLYKTYEFRDFMEAMDFAHKIAEVAEKESHHPNVTIAWGECSLEIWTHKIFGLTESDFVLAAKIEAIKE